MSDSFQAWQVASQYELGGAGEPSDAAALAMQQLSIYLKFLYGYYVFGLTMVNDGGGWMPAELTRVGLSTHAIWMSNALILNSVRAAGAGAVMPPNWSLELTSGYFSMSAFMTAMLDHAEAWGEAERQEHLQMSNVYVWLLIVLCCCMVSALSFLCGLALRARVCPRAATGGGVAAASHFLQAEVLVPLRAVGAGLNWLHNTVDSSTAALPDFKDPVFHTYSQLRLVHMAVTQATPGLGARSTAATVRVPELLCEAAARSRLLVPQGASLIVACDAPLMRGCELPDITLQLVIGHLLGLSLRRAGTHQVRVTCSFVAPVQHHRMQVLFRRIRHLHRRPLLCARQWLRAQAGSCRRPRHPEHGCLLFNFNVAGRQVDSSIEEEIMHVVLETGQAKGQLGLKVLHRIVTRQLGGIFLLGQRADRQAGCNAFFTVPLSTSDSSALEAEAGQAGDAPSAVRLPWLGQVSLPFTPPVLYTVLSQEPTHELPDMLNSDEYESPPS